MKKYSFNKIASAITSAAMVTSTVALAAAANYPAPFVENGAADVAVVYGADAAQTDLAAVLDVTNDLSEELAATASSTTSEEATVSGGDFVKLAKSTDNINLGDTMSGTFGTSINDDDLEDLLADGVYTNDENTEFAYEQKISITTLELTHFADSDYKDKEPTVGFKISSNTYVMNYSLDFSTDAESDVGASTSGCSDGDLCDIEKTNLPLLGKTYYVSDADNSTLKLTLLDSANSGSVAEGETTTLVVDSTSYDVSIYSLTTSEARLMVNGEITNTLSEGESYKLSDGTYVGLKDIYQRDVAGITGSVEFSLGTGKLEIDDSTNTVELNDDTIEEIKGFVERGTPSDKQKIDKIILEWTTDDEEFITPDQELVMPGFGAVKFSMGSFITPSEEVVKVLRDGDAAIELQVPLKDGTVKFNILGANATGELDAIGGDDADEHLAISDDDDNLLFNVTDNYDEWFVATYNTSKDAESYLLTASVSTSNNKNRTTIKKYEGSNLVEVCKDKVKGDTCDIGDVSLTIEEVYKVGSSKWINVSGGTNVNFNTMFTAGGLKIFLPFEDTNVSTTMGAINLSTGKHPGYVGIAGHNHDSFTLWFDEENKDGDKAGGEAFNVTINDNSDGELHVSAIDTAQTEHKILGTDNDVVSRVESELATQVKRLVSSDKGEAEITYHDEECYADVYVTAVDASVTSGTSELGSVSVLDSEVSSVADKNLIVVGGSCVNTVAAELLGSDSPICGADFTTTTGVAAGEFLIETFSRSGGKVATLVAGYNAGDTTNAVNALTTQTVDTSIGSKYKGASATSIELVTESA